VPPLRGHIVPDVTVVGIAVAGACGALARYGLEGVVSRRWPGAFPWGTFVVNISGAFLIGLRNAEIDDNAILIKCEVADLDPRQLRSSEGAPKAHQHKCLVAQSGPRPQARPTMLRMSLLSRGDFPI